MKIYFAGPLFSEAERDWIRSNIRKIQVLAEEKGFKINIIFPYDLIAVEEMDSLGDQAKQEIFRRCRSHLHDADMMIALLDGTQVDDGTAWEIGYFYRGRTDHSPIVGIRTDFRPSGESNGSVVNAMIECCCDRIVRSSEEMLETLSELFSKGR